MSAVLERVLIYGGRGALGSKCVSVFKSNNFWVASVDFVENLEADLNITVNQKENPVEQEAFVLALLDAELNMKKLDAVLCVAGGWCGGNAGKDLAKTSEQMWNSSVNTSLISTSVAVRFLKPGGLLVLTGAKAALDKTPTMIGYGLAKNAVHFLTKTLVHPDSGFDSKSTVVAVLPEMLDTANNRKWIASGDFSSLTPLEFLTELFLKWIRGKDVPVSGSLLQVVTKHFVTDVVPVEYSYNECGVKSWILPVKI